MRTERWEKVKEMNRNQRDEIERMRQKAKQDYLEIKELEGRINALEHMIKQAKINLGCEEED